MQVAQVVLSNSSDVPTELMRLQPLAPSILFVFGDESLLKSTASHLAVLFPAAIFVGCSTAGEISDKGVTDHTCVVTAVRFDKTSLFESTTRLIDMADSHAAGQRLGQQLPQVGLRAVLVFGQGVAINGSALISGMTHILGTKVLITGGLAGDDAAFTQTWVLDTTGVHSDQLVCIGLYGDQLNFSHGSFGGWSPFGPARKVTRCSDNVLFELDGEAALDVYKRYLGEHAKDLPASSLLFPLTMLGRNHNEVGLIRTILGVSDADGSLTLAGDIDPEGYLRLMHANTDDLVDGAETAAQLAQTMIAGKGPGLALLVSCVGRKLVMGGRVDEEVEAVASVFGKSAVIAGFYSNGEISPLIDTVECKLHNQTMTITHISEL
jgi:hypothetical protein